MQRRQYTAVIGLNSAGNPGSFFTLWEKLLGEISGRNFFPSSGVLLSMQVLPYLLSSMGISEVGGRSGVFHPWGYAHYKSILSSWKVGEPKGWFKSWAVRGFQYPGYWFLWQCSLLKNLIDFWSICFQSILWGRNHTQLYFLGIPTKYGLLPCICVSRSLVLFTLKIIWL